MWKQGKKMKIGLAQHAREWIQISISYRSINPCFIVMETTTRIRKQCERRETRAHCTHSLIDFNKVKLSKWPRNTSPYWTRMSATVMPVAVRSLRMPPPIVIHAKHTLVDKAYCLHFYLFHFFSCCCSLFYQFIECAYYFGDGDDCSDGRGNCSYNSR